jgi:diguanylate cyclase (GGDEF)-like protein/PAS domain S-box-containing protein
MAGRLELLESALNTMPHGIGLLGRGNEVVFWNQAAEAITGYAATEVMGQPLPGLLSGLREPPRQSDPQSGRGILVQLHHKLGHAVAVIARAYELRDALGDAIGTATLFHPAERLDALPHGAGDGNADLQQSQEEFEERLRQEFEDFERGGEALGVLWISVDQGPELRKSHGAAASQTMLDKVQRALASGLRPAEELARWGESEFLVITHERTAAMLAAHARALAGLARTADFRWWGDRISITVSVGAAQAMQDDTLQHLLERARQAMEASTHEGGNRASEAREERRGGEA